MAIGSGVLLFQQAGFRLLALSVKGCCLTVNMPRDAVIDFLGLKEKDLIWLGSVSQIHDGE